MTEATKTSNPLQDDPGLRLLLEELETISTRKGFQRWRASFLEKLDDYVSLETRAPAQACYETFSQSVGQLSNLVKKLFSLLQQGQLTVDRTTVRARKCLSDLQGQIDVVVNNMEAMLPATTEQEKEVGFTKFHLGAVLVQDGFCEYDRLVICDEILSHMKQTSVNDVCDRQLVDQMEMYHDRLGMFCDVMADLQLYKVMEKCRELMKLQEEEESSSHYFDMEEDEGLLDKQGETEPSSESGSESSDSSASMADSPLPSAPPKKVKEAATPVAGPTRFVVHVSPRRHSMASMPVVGQAGSDDDAMVPKTPVVNQTAQQKTNKVNDHVTGNGNNSKNTTTKKETQKISSMGKQDPKMSRRHSTLGCDRPGASGNVDSGYSMNPYYSGKKWNEWEDLGDSKVPRFTSFKNYYHGSQNPEDWRIGAALRNANKKKEERSLDEADLLTKAMPSQSIKDKLNQSCPQLQSRVALEDEGDETTSEDTIGSEIEESESFDCIIESEYPANKDWRSVLGPVGKDGCPKSFRGLSDGSMHRSTHAAPRHVNKKAKKYPSLPRYQAADKKKSRNVTAKPAKKDLQSAKESKPKSLKSKFSNMFNKPESPASTQEEAAGNTRMAKKKVPSWAKPENSKRPVQSAVAASNEPSPLLKTSSEEKLALAMPKGQLPETRDASKIVPQKSAEPDKKWKKPNAGATKTSKPSGASPGQVGAKDISRNPAEAEDALDLLNCVSDSVALGERSAMAPESPKPPTSPTKNNGGLVKRLSSRLFKTEPKQKARPVKQTSSSKLSQLPPGESRSEASASPSPENSTVRSPKNAPPPEAPQRSSRASKPETNLNRQDKGPGLENMAEQAPLGEAFGYAVSMSSDGTIYASGAPRHAENKGRVSVLICRGEDKEDGGEWTPLGQTLRGKNEGDYFGAAVAVSGDGNVVAVGSPQLSQKNQAGYVRVYRYQEDDNYWAPMGDIIRGKQPGECFGWSLSLSSDGQQVVVGGPQHAQQQGVVRVYRFQKDRQRWVQRGRDVRGESAGASVAMTHNGQTAASSSPDAKTPRAFSVQQ